MGHSDSSGPPKPSLIQKRKFFGCFVIIFLIAVGALILVLGLSLGIGLPVGISQAVRLEETMNIDDLMNLLQVCCANICCPLL